jgi:hypothetical protein
MEKGRQQNGSSGLNGHLTSLNDRSDAKLLLFKAVAPVIQGRSGNRPAAASVGFAAGGAR